MCLLLCVCVCVCVCVRVIPAWHHHHLPGTTIMAGILQRERGRERGKKRQRRGLIAVRDVAFSCFNISERRKEKERGEGSFLSSVCPKYVRNINYHALVLFIYSLTRQFVFTTTTFLIFYQYI